MSLNWLRTSPRQIRTEDGRYVIYRDGDTGPYFAWGPEGSQDVSLIQAHTAAAIRRHFQVEKDAAALRVSRGRALIGKFDTADEAKDACAAHSSMAGDGEQHQRLVTAAAGLNPPPSPPPHSRATDPETSHEAGGALTRSGRRAAQLDEAERAVREHPGRTSKRLALMTGIERHMLGRRLPDLEKLGRVRKGPPADDPAGRGVTWWPVHEEAR